MFEEGGAVESILICLCLNKAGAVTALTAVTPSPCLGLNHEWNTYIIMELDSLILLYK